MESNIFVIDGYRYASEYSEKDLTDALKSARIKIPRDKLTSKQSERNKRKTKGNC